MYISIVCGRRSLVQFIVKHTRARMPFAINYELRRIALHTFANMGSIPYRFLIFHSIAIALCLLVATFGSFSFGKCSEKSIRCTFIWIASGLRLCNWELAYALFLNNKKQHFELYFMQFFCLIHWIWISKLKRPSAFSIFQIQIALFAQLLYKSCMRCTSVWMLELEKIVWRKIL